MDIKTLKSIVKIMRNEGVLSLKTSEIELTLAHEALLPKSAPLNTQKEFQESDGMTQEDLLFYSSNPDSNNIS
jgi:hypothetical protein